MKNCMRPVRDRRDLRNNDPGSIGTTLMRERHYNTDDGSINVKYSTNTKKYPISRIEALECDLGYRVSTIRRTKTYYNVLGSLTIECEQIARAEGTTCTKQSSIPKCSGQHEGIESSQRLLAV
ncbi:hypothetical protein DICVIV_08348 [Dictyocaulus viviparus]|uniref:Uncharacterized protein n=1 Tax=Dictyocaulus viviparus TaxID=29172 RepID=A0A0D8XPD2_DICVI|nr:hypothetical protein DICVIV_08348 [Dictyocaulus viviparus]